METESPNQRLSQISTIWSLVQQAHAGSPEAVSAAQRLLMERYCGAVYRYLLGALHDEDAALELFQEFAMRFVRGNFRHADPQRGRFRDYLKTALIHLVRDYCEARGKWPHPLPADLPGPPADTSPPSELDEKFLRSWREELIERTWSALARDHATYHAVLRLHVCCPDMPSLEMAAELASQLGKQLSAANVRVTLHRAREAFAELLIEEVAQSMPSPTFEQLHDELDATGLAPYCRFALDRRRVSAPGSAADCGA